MRLSLTLALAPAAVVLATAEANTGGGLRKNKTQRNLQDRAIICSSTGGVASSGLVPTAPSYQDCYLNGCPSARDSLCADSSHCAAGSCCMPTSIYGKILESWSLERNIISAFGAGMFISSAPPPPSAIPPLTTQYSSLFIVVRQFYHNQARTAWRSNLCTV